MTVIRSFGFLPMVFFVLMCWSSAAIADAPVKEISVEVRDENGRGREGIDVILNNLGDPWSGIGGVGRTGADGKVTFTETKDGTKFPPGVYGIWVEDSETERRTKGQKNAPPTRYFGFAYVGPDQSHAFVIGNIDLRRPRLKASTAKRRIQEAIRANDRAGYDAVLQEYDDGTLEDELEVKQMQEAAEDFRKANNLPQFNSVKEVDQAINTATELEGVPGRAEKLEKLKTYRGVLEGIQDSEEFLQRRKDARRTLPRYPKAKETSMVPAGPGSFYASAGAGGHAVDQPNFQYVRFSDFNTQQIILSPVFDFDNDDVGVEAGGEVGYVLPIPFFGRKDWVAVQFSYADVENDAAINQIQGLNADAEFFGPAGGGFTILGAPDVFLNNVMFSNDYSHLSVNLRGYSDIPHGTITLTPFVGIDYGRIELDTSLALTVVGVPPANVTRTDSVDSDEIGLTFGLYASHALDTNVTLYGGGHGTVAYSDADGSSTLTQDSGFGMPVETANISGSQATVKAGAGLGVRYDFNDRISVGFEGRFDFSNGAPVVQYSSQLNQPATVDFDTVNSFSFGANLIVSFD